MVQSVHQALGGGSVADVLLWRRPSASAVVLVSSTALWFLFEQAGYNLLSFVSNVLFLLVVILFLWAKSASLLNRPLPPLPDLEISEESISKAADAFQVYVNSVLSIGREIAIGRNLTVFLQVAIGLWLVSVVGSLCSFLTLCYIGVLVSLSVPLSYEKFQYQIDEKLDVAHRVIETQYKKLDDGLLKKIPLSSNKEKKLQ